MPTRPPLARVPLFLRCTGCLEPFRAVGSFLGPAVVRCPSCGRLMRLVPCEGTPTMPMPRSAAIASQSPHG